MRSAFHEARLSVLTDGTSLQCGRTSEQIALSITANGRMVTATAAADAVATVPNKMHVCVYQCIYVSMYQCMYVRIFVHRKMTGNTPSHTKRTY